VRPANQRRAVDRCGGAVIRMAKNKSAKKAGSYPIVCTKSLSELMT